MNREPFGHPAVHADGAGALAAAVRLRRRVLRRARLVSQQEAVHRRRGRRAGRGKRAVLRGRARPHAAAAAAEAGVLGSVQGRRAASQRLRPLRARRPGAAAAQAAGRRRRRRPGPRRRDPRVPVDADLQAADRRRADQHRAVALRQALLVDLDLGQDADRLHPVPRLRRGDGHDHDDRRQPPVAGDRPR